MNEMKEKGTQDGSPVFYFGDGTEEIVWAEHISNEAFPMCSRSHPKRNTAFRFSVRLASVLMSSQVNGFVVSFSMFHWTCSIQK